MKKIKILSVVGARPNFMKIAPLLREFRKHKRIESVLVHTGQHYSCSMSDIFIKELKIGRHIALKAGPGEPIEQVKKIMGRFRKVLVKERPDIVVVVGDVNSTLACALVSASLGIKVAHVEAGLRSFDFSMPEEINRKFTDAISDYLFVTEPSGLKNLRDEAIPDERIFFVGNIMIDSLVSSIKAARKKNTLSLLGVKRREYALLTLHRPSNVDNANSLSRIVNILKKIAKMTTIVYPAHPRAVKMLKALGYWENLKRINNIIITRPLGYLDFLRLMIDAKFVLTDSGGIQEETTYLGIPCFTIRKNTERPVTITQGTNTLVGDNQKLLISLISRLPRRIKRKIPKLWDGKTARRITAILMRAASG
ncbi:MAG: UDP-N-acetylglucosamine 2-epimerase (non-hydrolyzing) [Candidatus Omnitrophica bacterium]|nr:UDP-N-acetylglucosamine 2-epimerase (non-hydrolyzing) [Candidatus Omnitrophota bacterium]MCM8791330.1 UDP-N-acetylglucosamine 2-epimerase (non-hydrolyzing) [Candidatus Omnitrophota bacterium]